MFERIGVAARNFNDPETPNSTGLILEVPAMERVQPFMASDEAKMAMREDRLKVETM